MLYLCSVKHLKLYGMKKLNFKQQPFSIESGHFLASFDLVASQFLTSLSSQSIRGFLATSGNNCASIFASSVFHHFVVSNKNSFVIPFGSKVGNKKEVHYFSIYRRSNSFVVNFCNFHNNFVNVNIYIDGDYSVHFLK